MSSPDIEDGISPDDSLDTEALPFISIARETPLERGGLEKSS